MLTFCLGEIIIPINVVKVLILLISLLVFSFSPVHAQDESSQSAAFPSPTPKTIEYFMAYPGILPDNPLYLFKAARDRLVGILISDAYKRTDFYILNSDKRLSAALSLFAKNKPELAITTLSKSNNYMHMAISELALVKEEKKDHNALREKARTSIDKHLELLNQYRQHMDKKYLQKFDFELTRLQDLKRLVLPRIKK